MARPANLQLMIRELGRQHRPATVAEPKRARAASGKACKVHGCARKATTKGLCGTHYLKGRRLKMNLDGLSAAQLAELARDGRAARWQK